jgi:hypothetical protein
LSPRNLVDEIPDLRTIIEDWQSEQLNRRLAKTTLAAKRDDTALEDILRKPMELPAGLQRIERKIEGVSAGNLLGVKVERLPKRVFDTKTAR